MKPIRCLIFDLDGTLIDSSRGVVEAVNYSLRELNQPEQSAERISRYIGFPLSVMYPDFTDQPFERLYPLFQKKAAETIVASAEPLDGAEETLRDLHSCGIRMAVVTTKIRAHVDGILAKMDWKSFFEVSVGGNEVARVKPEPDAFHVALKKLSAAPENCAAVGDTINDVLAAQAVPMRVVAVHSPYGGREELEASAPDYLVESIGEIPALLTSQRLAIREDR